MPTQTPQTPGTNTPQVDPTALALSRAIRSAEGGDYNNTTGDAGTSKGAYQWQPGHFEQAAKQYGLDPNDFSPTNQDHVAYEQIKSELNKGHSQSQVASWWNSGRYDSTGNVGDKTINGKVIHFDTPAYVAKVQKAYQEQMQQGGNFVDPSKQQTGGSFVTPPANTSTTLAENTPVENTAPKSFLDEAGGNISNAIQGTANALSDTAQRKINPLSGILQSAGALAGGVGDVTNTALTHLPLIGGVTKGGEDLIGKVAQGALSTDLGKSAVKGYQGFEQAHPELAKDIGAGFNIVTALPILKGLSIAKNAAGTGIKTALKGSTDAALEVVAPKLSAKEVASAITRRGTSTKGILRETTLNPDPKVVELAQTVKSLVPDFNPSKGLVYNVDKIGKVVKSMADELKQKVIAAGADRIYPFKELASRIAQAEEPLSIRGTAFEKQIRPLKNAVVEIAKKSGGKVSNLLDVRQEFDNLVKKTYPNLYSTENAPMRGAIKAVRDAITGFTEENLPKDIGLRSNLLTQHKLITAMENMAEKASAGVEKEIGSTALSRFGKRHPILKGMVKGTGKAAATGLGVKGAMDFLP